MCISRAQKANTELTYLHKLCLSRPYRFGSGLNTTLARCASSSL
jgi:hypothetical protein